MRAPAFVHCENCGGSILDGLHIDSAQVSCGFAPDDVKAWGASGDAHIVKSTPVSAVTT